MTKKIVLAICGASGSVYGIRLLKYLLEMPVSIYLVVSKTGSAVMEHETGLKGVAEAENFKRYLEKIGTSFHEKANLTIYDHDNLFAPIASGSFIHEGMVIAPCSMKTLGAIASGISDNLIHRSADVCLKEKRRLILLARETPLSAIHLKNMYRATISGATIMPPCPGFYLHPKTVDDLIDSVVTRILDHLKLNCTTNKRWGM